MNTASDQAFEMLLNYLKRHHALDFTKYKRPNLMRQIKKRMTKLKLESYEGYLDYLKENVIELTDLFDAILLNVTTFFRDASAWQYLAQEIIPQIIASKPKNEPIRIWSAGCASGEEAYTISIILAEALGSNEFQERVRIYATDIDEDILAQGRLATYTSMAVRDVPPPLLAKYFDVNQTFYTFSRQLRQSVIFGRHNLVQDAPISRLDLLICRNTLMYFNTETQVRILARFHFALKETGFLFVGKAEMLLSQANLFAPVQFEERVFSKLAKVRHNRTFVVPKKPVVDSRLQEAAFECLPVAQIIVDIYGNLLLANRQARSLFCLSNSDWGCSLQDLSIPLLTELRLPIEQAYTKRQQIQLSGVKLITAIDKQIIFFNIEIIPLRDCYGELLGISIVFINLTPDNFSNIKD